MELEKIKTLLFDKDQYAVFERIPKPVLYEPVKQQKGAHVHGGHGESNEDSEFLLTSGTSFWNHVEHEVKMKEFFESLERIKSKRELDPMDKKLLDIVGNFD